MSLLSFQGCRALFTTRRRPITCSPGWASLQSQPGRGRGAVRAITRALRRPLARIALQVVHAPVFTATLSRLPSNSSGRPRLRVEEALSGGHLDLVLEDTDSPRTWLLRDRTTCWSDCAELDARNSSQISRLWLWPPLITAPPGENAVACALDLRRLRRKGRCSKAVILEGAESGEDQAALLREEYDLRQVQ